jgi:hypothetical protein
VRIERDAGKITRVQPSKPAKDDGDGEAGSYLYKRTRLVFHFRLQKALQCYLLLIMSTSKKSIGITLLQEKIHGLAKKSGKSLTDYITDTAVCTDFGDYLIVN